MTPLRRSAIVLLVLAVLAGACSGGDEEIAGVGGTVIRLSDIDALYEGDSLPIDEGFRETLFRMMAVEALAQALAADYGVTVDPAKADEYLTQLEASMAQEGATPAQFLGVANAAEEMVRFNAELLALRDAAIDELIVAPETVERLFADPATMTTVCAEHILVATQEEAEAVKGRLVAGEDFATVAGEVSLDTASEGGDLGCAPASGYVPEFAQATMEATFGEITGPVQTEFGFHVLIVSERTTSTREEYLANPRGLLSDQDMSGIWSTWFNGVLQAADAWVAERFGTWTPIGIEPPASETTTTTTATTTSGG